MRLMQADGHFGLPVNEFAAGATSLRLHVTESIENAFQLAPGEVPWLIAKPTQELLVLSRLALAPIRADKTSLLQTRRVCN